VCLKFRDDVFETLKKFVFLSFTLNLVKICFWVFLCFVFVLYYRYDFVSLCDIEYCTKIIDCKLNCLCSLNKYYK